ncbi:hypothetical protein CYY_000068 [Polysphondylium violaceum]|uniref:UDP-MurNAc-pentapeptide synthetase n=1 Tax=Polysphondylium violaceum TaxID=133409 RepID=A0A8J4Q4R5_9MYCE|nr:hypothetical protein CYY_000068 [Polysphondylium violaceum]
MEQLYQLYLQHPVVTTDSRACLPNSIFVALRGENFNGNAFAGKALEQGCAYAIVDQAEYAEAPKTILVDNCLQTLQELAKHHRGQCTGTTLIAITGSNGKTTTKELVASVLSQKYKTLFTQGNLNNAIGLPLTLLKLRNDHEFAVIEMGASGPGDIKTLCEIAQPDIGIITNVGKAHLKGFGSFEGVIKAKGELYDYIRSKKGKIFINHSNQFLQEISSGLDKFEYGTTSGLFVSGKVNSERSLYFSFDWKTNNSELQLIQTQLVGEYNLENALAAAAIGSFFNVETALINSALQNYVPKNNRSQLKKTQHNTLIIDAYNANPTSMYASLLNFKNINVSPKAVILGDMLQVGEYSKEEHQKIVDLLVECQLDKVFLIGECFSSTKNQYNTFGTLSDFIDKISEINLIGFTILIKASRGLKLERTIEYL